MDELIDAVLAWWEDHKDDTYPCGHDDEYNLYDEPPEFVKIAQKLKELR